MKNWKSLLLTIVAMLTACPLVGYADIPTTPQTASTDAAKKLYSYFVEQYGQKTISSVMADVNWNNKCAEEVKTLTGKYPAMNCYDFIHIHVPNQSSTSWINYSDITPVSEWHDAGGSTWENKWFYEQMDKVIAVVLKLQDAGIAATWRPFHEAAGNATAKEQASWTKAWFWWGYDGADTFKKLWVAMYDYFQQKGVKNLIWIWTTQNYNGDSNSYNQDTDWYPGDQYCDIVARDQLPNLDPSKVEFESATQAVKNMGVGWNLGNTLEANRQTETDMTKAAYWGQQDVTSETCWGQFVTKPELLKMMKDAGYGAIRVPVTWYNHTDIDGNIDAAWMKRVHEVVDYVINQGMYCIINVHHDTGADSDSFKSWLKADATSYTNNKARYENIWKQIANEFKDYGEKLLFESYNEMLDSYNSWNYASSKTSSGYSAAEALKSYTAINNYAQSFVDVVRATGGNNAARNLIVNTYGASCGYGSWSTYLTEPLTKLKKPTGENNHIIFEVHNYPNIEKLSEAKTEVDSWISKLNTNIIERLSAPVIIGEWGTSNVDGGAGKTDYDVRRSDMLEFVDYFIKQTKASSIGTFYWMGLTDGIARTLPAFTQADLALKMLQAWYGSDYNPTLPTKDEYGDATISCTVNYTDQYGEFNLIQGINAADYQYLRLELGSAPASGSLQFKAYGDKNTEEKITTKNKNLQLAGLGNITRITLQLLSSAPSSVKINKVYLVKKDGSKEIAEPSVFWGCTISDVEVVTGIQNVTYKPSDNDAAIYNLSGQRVTSPTRGIYIRNGKKVIIK